MRDDFNGEQLNSELLQYIGELRSIHTGRDSTTRRDFLVFES
jgi:hypothetical protein